MAREKVLGPVIEAVPITVLPLDFSEGIDPQNQGDNSLLGVAAH